MRLNGLSFLVSATLLVLSAADAAHAADLADKKLLVELNKLEPAGGDCRTTWVLSNGTDKDLDSLKLDIVAFDKDGIVARRVAAEMGPIAQTHTRVKLFDLKSIACGDVGRILMNGVLACEIQGAEATAPEQCAAEIQTASRSAVPFSQ